MFGPEKKLEGSLTIIPETVLQQTGMFAENISFYPQITKIIVIIVKIVAISTKITLPPRPSRDTCFSLIILCLLSLLANCI